MSLHDLKARELQLSEIKSAILADPIFIKSILRYSEANTFENPLDIPDLQTIHALIAGIGVNTDSFTNADLESDGAGGFYLPYILGERTYPIGFRIDYDGGGFELLSSNYSTIDEAFTGFTNDNDSTITLFLMGTGVAPPPIPSPTITLQPPTTANIYQGRSLVIFIDGTDITGYQWRKNTVDIPGFISNTLTISNFQVTDNGSYRCFVFNSSGNALSNECIASMIYPEPSEILLINNSTENTIYQNDFGSSQPLNATDVVSITPMINGQAFYIEIPVGCTLEYQRFNSDGSFDGTVFINENVQVYATSASINSMNNSKGHQFLIRTT